MQPYPYGGPQTAQQPPQQPMTLGTPVAWPQHPQRPRRMNAATLAGIVLVIVGLLFAVIATFSSWWGMTGTSTSSYLPTPVSMRIDFYYGQYCGKTSLMGISGTTCMQYFDALEPIADVFAITFFVALGGVICAILTLVFLVISVFRPSGRYGLIACGLVGSILLVLAPIYIFGALPAAFNSVSGASFSAGGQLTGFFGHVTESQMGFSVDMSYGGGLGWFMSFLAFIILLVGTITAFWGLRPVPLPQPYWGQPAAYPFVQPPPTVVTPPEPAAPAAPGTGSPPPGPSGDQTPKAPPEQPP